MAGACGSERRSDDPTPTATRLAAPACWRPGPTLPGLLAARARPDEQPTFVAQRVAEGPLRPVWAPVDVEFDRAAVLALWPPEERERAACVAEHESHWNADAVGDAGERGIFQILPWAHIDKIHALGYTEADLFQPMVNARIARTIWEDSGWQPWTTALLCVE